MIPISTFRGPFCDRSRLFAVLNLKYALKVYQKKVLKKEINDFIGCSYEYVT